MLARCTIALLMLASLVGCAGSVTGNEAGLGLGRLDTVSKEEIENEAWFDEFYGRRKEQ